MEPHPDQLDLFPEAKKEAEKPSVPMYSVLSPPMTQSVGMVKADGTRKNALQHSVDDYPVQFVINRLRQELNLPAPEELPSGSVCALTGAPIRSGYFQNNYGVQQALSPLAACFTSKAADRLGVERMAGVTPVGYALCKIAGAKVIVPFDSCEPVEIWTGGKYLNRVRGEYFKISACTGHASYRDLLNREIDGAVFEMSLRIERVLKHFRVSTPENLVIMTEKGALVVPRKNWSHFESAFSELNKKNRREFVSVARALLAGKKNLLDEDMQTKLRQEAYIMDLFRLLPANPQAALVYLQAAGVEGAQA